MHLAKKVSKVGSEHHIIMTLEPMFSLTLLMSNICGPQFVASLVNSQYFIMFTNDASCKTWVHFLLCKFEVFFTFKKQKKWSKPRPKKRSCVCEHTLMPNLCQQHCKAIVVQLESF